MKIPILFIPSEDLRLDFVDYPGGKRLWIRNNNIWFPTGGWCPHLSSSRVSECRDCGLVLEVDDD